MKGSIAGDVIGSRFEARTCKSKEFELLTGHCRPTDDSVLTAAVAEALLTDRNYYGALRRWARRYPRAGYGSAFQRWLWREDADATPYQSFGNGSAMRVGAVAWLSSTLDDVLDAARDSAMPTHDHTEGVKGAQAVAVAVFLARHGTTKDGIRTALESRFGYDLSRRLEDIRPSYTFDVTCQGSVPEAIIAFLESTDWEDAVRNAISLGGDADTQACMAGAVAEAFYGGVPAEIWTNVEARLPEEMKAVLTLFADEVAQRS